MAQFTSSIEYQKLADNVLHLLKDPVKEERLVTIAQRDFHVIEIVGSFEIFDIIDMDWWRAQLKFELRDVEPKDEEERAMRGMVAMYAPELAATMTARSTVTVYKHKEDEWVEATEEFIKRCQHDVRWEREV